MKFTPRPRHYAFSLMTLIGSCGGAGAFQSCAPMPAPADAPAPVTQQLSATGETMVVGYSAGGNPITAERYGDGGPVIVVVAQIHGNEDAPLVVAQAVREHAWQDNTVWLVPTLNPDGAGAHVRTNGRGVDLNRDGALSQPESQALLNLVNTVQPSLIMHVHSPSNYVGFYGNGNTRAIAQAVADAAGMPMRGYVANHPFLWVGTGGENILVEVPAISASDCGTCTDNRTQSDAATVRGMADAIVSTLDASV